jgi:uncharacterized protein (TIGR02246 family)
MERFTRCVHGRDLDALMALYEPDALFTPRPGVVLRGRDAIRAALGEMLALSPTMESTVREVHEVGDIALVVNDWKMRGRAPDGTEVTQGGTSADVLRRQSDGSWRVLIDHP